MISTQKALKENILFLINSIPKRLSNDTDLSNLPIIVQKVSSSACIINDINYKFPKQEKALIHDSFLGLEKQFSKDIKYLHLLKLLKKQNNTNTIFVYQPKYVKKLLEKGISLSSSLLPEAILSVPKIPIINSFSGLSFENILNIFNASKIIASIADGLIIGNTTLAKTLINLEQIEYLAKVKYLALKIGINNELDKNQIDKLTQIASDLGTKKAVSENLKNLPGLIRLLNTDFKAKSFFKQVRNEQELVYLINQKILSEI
ncbi:MAG: hypothetical protein ABIA04_14620 [Pseudomonadota bacterium]